MNFVRQVYGKAGSNQSSQAWVFIHGWGSDHQLWQPLCERLAQRVGGLHYVVDLPGFGDCAAHEESVQVGGWQAYLSKLIKALPDNAIVVGWSLGGMLATQLAAQAPQKVKALITLASNPSFIQREGWPHAMAPSTLEGFQRQFEARPLKTWTRFCALQAQGSEFAKSVLSMFKAQKGPDPQVSGLWAQGLAWLADIDNRQVVGVLQQPGLHLLGEGDALVPDSLFDYWQTEWSHPGSEVKLVKGAGHSLHLSQTDAVAGHVCAWFASHVRQKPSEPIDKRKIAESFGKAAPIYDSAARLQQQVALALVQQSQAAGLNVSRLLDLACGTGYVSQFVSDRGLSVERLTQLDLALPMVQRAREKAHFECDTQSVCADAERLPFAHASFSSVISSLGIQWCYNLQGLAREAFEALGAGGSVALATLCEGTLSELKYAWAQVNDYVHVNPFHSQQQVISAFESAGFELVDQRAYTQQMQYQGLMPILRDLKTIGAHNMNPGQNPGLTSRKQFRALEEAYEVFRDAEGLLPVSYEVLQVVFKKINQEPLTPPDARIED